MEKSRPSSHIAGLDLIRLMAAMLVVFDHFTSHYRNTWVIDAIGGGVPSFPTLAPVTDAGWIGVDIFFVISGLVIAYTANGNSPRRFAESRFFRLMPSVWMVSTISALVLMFASSENLALIFKAYSRSLILSPVGPWVDGSFWTLAVEIVFYTLIFAILWRNKFGEIGRILGAFGVLVSALAIVTLVFSPRFPFLNAVLASWPSKLLLLNNGSEFIFGVFLYLILFIGVTPLRVLILAICFLGSCAQIIHHIFAIPAYAVMAEYGGFSGRSFLMWLPLLLWLAAVLAMIVSVRSNAFIKTRFSGAMPAIRQMGLLTYPLYLIHSPLGLVVMQRVYQATNSPMLALIAAITLVLLAAAAVLLLEPIFRAKIKSPVRRSADFAQSWFFDSRLAEPTSRVE